MQAQPLGVVSKPCSLVYAKARGGAIEMAVETFVQACAPTLRVAQEEVFSLALSPARPSFGGYATGMLLPLLPGLEAGCAGQRQSWMWDSRLLLHVALDQ